MKRWIVNMLLALDQSANAFFGGYPDETISSRCGRGYGKTWYWTALGDALNWLDPGHIQRAEENERDHLHEPAELR